MEGVHETKELAELSRLAGDEIGEHVDARVRLGSARLLGQRLPCHLVVDTSGVEAAAWLIETTRKLHVDLELTAPIGQHESECLGTIELDHQIGAETERPVRIGRGLERHDAGSVGCDRMGAGERLLQELSDARCSRAVLGPSRSQS